MNILFNLFIWDSSLKFEKLLTFWISISFGSHLNGILAILTLMLITLHLLVMRYGSCTQSHPAWQLSISYRLWWASLSRAPLAVTPANARILDQLHRNGWTVEVACFIPLSLLADKCKSSSLPLLLMVPPPSHPDCFGWQKYPYHKRPLQCTESRVLLMHSTESASSILIRHNCSDMITQNRL